MTTEHGYPGAAHLFRHDISEWVFCMDGAMSLAA